MFIRAIAFYGYFVLLRAAPKLLWLAFEINKSFDTPLGVS